MTKRWSNAGSALLRLGAVLLALLLPPPAHGPANAQAADPALTGLVRSSQEGPMEGVLVSARRPTKAPMNAALVAAPANSVR